MKCTGMILFALSILPPASAQSEGSKAAIDQGYLTGADGVRLFYRKLGSGSDFVVFLHGGPGLSMHDGGSSIEPLSKDHTLILYDQRGGGRSDLVKDKSLLTAANDMRDLEALRAHFGIQKMTLIGLSWGSGLAALYANAHPEHVSKIVFLDPMPVARNPYVKERSDKIRGLVTPADNNRVEELEKLDETATDDQLIVNCREEDRISFKPYLYGPGNYDRGRQDACDDPPAAIRNGALVGQAVADSLGDFDFRPMLKKLSVPVLVVEGEKTNVPLDSTREWANAPSHARLLLIANAGHAAYVDQPAVLIRDLESFLEATHP
jgi:proline iminopeptidase